VRRNKEVTSVSLSFRFPVNLSLCRAASDQRPASLSLTSGDNDASEYFSYHWPLQGSMNVFVGESNAGVVRRFQQQLGSSLPRNLTRHAGLHSMVDVLIANITIDQENELWRNDVVRMHILTRWFTCSNKCLRFIVLS